MSDNAERNAGQAADQGGVDAIMSLINSKHLQLIKILATGWVSAVLIGSGIWYQLSRWQLHQANDWTYPEMVAFRSENLIANKDAGTKVTFVDPQPIHEAYLRQIGIFK
jgi:hypothetical protein